MQYRLLPDEKSLSKSHTILKYDTKHTTIISPSQKKPLLTEALLFPFTETVKTSQGRNPP
ncbi:hypothetical protein FUAX_11330 [Fulvitalea axinellae]|uniref:Uncharacterized protein n=1 Tax=Fulvitalea axinellae TaxID=1182444 RepID=A0AAU9CII5_9BACT|nr:hypothetical protein FUAX_11330 [Fulvitalea axinellae]